MVLQKKWRHIRDAYARDLKKQRESKSGSEAKTQRKYVYFDRLQFLSELYEIKPDSKAKNNQTGDDATAPTSKCKIKNSSANDNDDTNRLLKRIKFPLRTHELAVEIFMVDRYIFKESLTKISLPGTK